MFGKIWALFVRASATPLTVADPQVEKPKFLLPETAEKYLNELSVMSGAHQIARKTRRDLEVALADREQKLLAEEGTPAAKELNRRDAEKLRFNRHQNEPVTVTFETLRDGLEEKLLHEEREKIAHEGEIISQNFAGLDTDLHKTERRVVRFGGRVFLCSLKSTSATRKGGSYVGYKGKTQYHYVPTGDFGPPKVSWVTESLSQFTDEELRSIV